MRHTQALRTGTTQLATSQAVSSRSKGCCPSLSQIQNGYETSESSTPATISPCKQERNRRLVEVPVRVFERSGSPKRNRDIKQRMYVKTKACAQTINMAKSSQEKDNHKVSFKIFSRGAKALPDKGFKKIIFPLAALAARVCETSRKTAYIPA